MLAILFLVLQTSANPSFALAVPPSDVRITDIGLPSNTVRLGGRITLTCLASGTNPRQYKWYHNSTIIPAATSTTYRATSAQFSAAGQYTCEVSNWVGNDSGTYTLRVQGEDHATLLVALNPLPSLISSSSLVPYAFIACLYITN